MAEILKHTLGSLLGKVAGDHGDNDAIVDLPSGRTWTYRQLNQRALRAAKGLVALGLAPGSHVALWAPNIPRWLIAWFGMAKAGLVLTSVETSLGAEQVEYLLNQSGCSTLLMAPGIKGREFEDTLASICPELAGSEPGRLDSQALPSLKNVVSLGDQAPAGAYSWPELLAMGGALADEEVFRRDRAVAPDDVATLLYTSGTTGAPKGVMSTHFGIINVSARSADNMRLSPSDRLCLSVPLSHMFGCVCVTLAALTKAAAIVIPSVDFSPRSLLAASEQQACTAIFGSPNAFLAIMDQPDYQERDISSLRTGIMGGAQCPLEVMTKVVEKMGLAEVVLGYGQTEASSWVTMTSPDDPLELRVSTVGRALPDCRVKIVDPASGEEVPFGQVGEFCCQGFNMKGYYNMPAATKQAIDPKGWLHTGDMASVDAAGYCRIAGRLKETITKKGEAIYPSEVEEVLFTHEAVANAQVFGVPAGKDGEEVAAWVKLKTGARAEPQDLIAFCADRLPASQVPAYLKFVDQFPLTSLGKVQKFKLRQLYAAELGLK